MKVLNPQSGYWVELPRWERSDMTVCIAAVCDEGTDDKKIVFCADKKLSSPLGSSEAMIKVRPVGRSWRCLTSGTDTEILALLKALNDRFFSQLTIDETNALTFVKEALFNRKADKAERLVQSKFAMPYENFLAVGRARLPEDIFRKAVMEVGLINLDAEFILAGFPLGFPMLITTDAHCNAMIKEDFAAVGEGSYLAIASLLKRGHSGMRSLSRTLYIVYEAKRYAEGAPSVGRDTLIGFIRADSGIHLINADGLKLLSERYDQYGPKKLDELEFNEATLTSRVPEDSEETPEANKPQSATKED